LLCVRIKKEIPMRPTTLLAAAILTACAASPANPKPGPGPGPGPGPDPTTLTPTDFVTQLAGKSCAEALSCMAQYPTNGSDTFADAYGTSQDDCVQNDDNVADLGNITAAITKGTIDYDAESASTCLGNMMFPASCTDFFANYDYPDACYSALSGNVADGGACTTDWECSGDNSSCTAAKCAPDPAMLTGSKKRLGHR
jgi:hypothetical protein